MSPEKQFQDITARDQSNACVSYFFMSYLVLLSRSSNFSHPFIRAHARYAAIFHSIIIATLLAGLLLFSTRGQRVSLNFEILGIEIGHIISSVILIGCFFGLVHGLYKASRGETPSLKALNNKVPLHTVEEELSGRLDETNTLLVVASYIPYIGLFIAQKHKHLAETTFGSRVGTLYMILLMLVMLASKPGQNTIVMLFVFLYIILLFVRGAMLFFSQREGVHIRLPFHLPSMTVVHTFFRALPGYIFSFLKIAGGKGEKVDLRSSMLAIQISDKKRDDKHNKTEKDTSFPFPTWTIYVPFLNLIFFPRIFLSKRNIYNLAIAQSCVLMLLWFIVWGQQWDVAWIWGTLLLLTLGFVNVQSNPTYRIPIAYECVLVGRWIKMIFPKKRIPKK